jgi:hypothetical protein
VTHNFAPYPPAWGGEQTGWAHWNRHEAAAAEGDVLDQPVRNTVWGLVYAIHSADMAALIKYGHKSYGCDPVECQVEYWDIDGPNATGDERPPPPKPRPISKPSTLSWGKRGVETKMEVHIDLRCLGSGYQPRSEHVVWMNRRIKDAFRAGVPQNYVNEILRPSIPWHVMEQREDYRHGVRSKNKVLGREEASRAQGVEGGPGGGRPGQWRDGEQVQRKLLEAEKRFQGALLHGDRLVREKELLRWEIRQLEQERLREEKRLWEDERRWEEEQRWVAEWWAEQRRIAQRREQQHLAAKWSAAQQWVEKWMREPPLLTKHRLTEQRLLDRELQSPRLGPELEPRPDRWLAWIWQRRESFDWWCAEVDKARMALEYNPGYYSPGGSWESSYRAPVGGPVGTPAGVTPHYGAYTGPSQRATRRRWVTGQDDDTGSRRKRSRQASREADEAPRSSRRSRSSASSRGGDDDF